MEINWANASLFVFCVVLLMFSFMHFGNVEKLRAENAALAAELAETNAELEEVRNSVAFEGNRIDGLKLEMEQKDSVLGAEIEGVAVDLNVTKGKVASIEENFEQFQEEYIELQGQYAEKSAEYELLVGEIEDFELGLQEKMYWYTENADFGDETKGFLGAAEDCIEGGGVLNMPCVAHELEERGYEYRSEGKDYIKSLDEFEKDDGGDCEDWSIFVKAIINEMVKREGVKELRVVNFNSVGYFEVYEDDGVTYYYSHGDKNMKVEDLQVACFPVGGGYGHCALVSDDIIFEPQDGSFIAHAYWEDESYLMRGGGFVEVLIDDGDIHVDTGERWVSYADFIEEIGLILEK